MILKSEILHFVQNDNGLSVLDLAADSSGG
jgi:hypothetical protein